MARNDRAPVQAPKRCLTVAETLAQLELIDASIDSTCDTAPIAVGEFGGRDAVQACSQMTCIGLVARLPESAWAAMAAEHAEEQRLQSFKGRHPV